MAWTNPRTWAAEKLLSADLNPHVRDNLNYLKSNIGLGASVELTIAAGSVAKTKAYHDIDVEGGVAATDDLDTITGGTEGDVLFLRAENAARTIVLKDGAGAGKLDLRGNDIYLTDINQFVLLQHNGTEWVLVSGPNHVVEFTANAFQYPAPGTDWTPELHGAELGVSLAAKKCWLPLNFLKIGDQIISYRLVGDTTEGTGLTLDCQLYSIEKNAPPAENVIASGAIGPVSGSGTFDSEITLTNPEVIATDKQYTLEVLGTTQAGDTITVMGAEIKVIRLS